MTALEPSRLAALREALETTNPGLSSREIDELLLAVRRQHEDPEEHDRSLISERLSWSPEERLIDDFGQERLRGSLCAIRSLAGSPPYVSAEKSREEEIQRPTLHAHHDPACDSQDSKAGDPKRSENQCRKSAPCLTDTKGDVGSRLMRLNLCANREQGVTPPITYR